LPGRRAPSSTLDETVFEVEFSAALPFVADHRIAGREVIAGAVHVAWVMAAARHAFGWKGCALEKVELLDAIVLAPAEKRVATLRLLHESASSARFEIASAETAHARGALVESRPAWPARDPAQLRAGLTEHIDGASFYREIGNAGYELGASFRWPEEI